MPEYAEKEKEAIEQYGIGSKPGKAKAVAQHCDMVPKFITQLKRMLETVEVLG
jgi:putative ATP-dependent endonuclease of OLD family